ncbi:hypothetical protein H6F67_12720 [Microcoleus sp. FACHB-1515]|uniref:hypothetical protein n=1 Tax=Cyanophyceae TaxID=3028117 RepID=UPI0016856800|nr:hypothetical protein [Microcoleus sp. FACHB-1515]MBD2090718.1 hypothetical protein [Microcoleus sp. FACHB-1515]
MQNRWELIAGRIFEFFRALFSQTNEQTGFRFVPLDDPQVERFFIFPVERLVNPSLRFSFVQAIEKVSASALDNFRFVRKK